VLAFAKEFHRREIKARTQNLGGALGAGRVRHRMRQGRDAIRGSIEALVRLLMSVRCPGLGIGAAARSDRLRAQPRR
jgi:hypothetical protein